MSTTAIVNSTDQYGKSANKSVPNVNPAATNEQLVEFGQMVTAVSNNTYGGTIRVDKTDCDHDAKVRTSFTRVGSESMPFSNVTKAGSGGLKVASFVGSNPVFISALDDVFLRIDGSDLYIYVEYSGSTILGTVDTFLYMPETARQTASTLHIQFTG